VPPEGAATPVQTRGPDPATPGNRAGIVRRWSAALYELLLLAALTFILQFALLPLVTPGHAGNVQTLVVPPLPAQVFLFCAQFAVIAAYFCWCWTGGRRTLPQKTWRLRVVTRTGAVLDGKRALLRYFAVWIGPLLAVALYTLLLPHGLGKLAALALVVNFLWALVDAERQFLHDRIAGTRIVRAS
jgi:uncharacterized RDD family membrane protein YckC